MFRGFDLSWWITPATAALMIGTVWVGIRGLYQDDLAKKGKLTAAGRRLAVTMIVLGGLSLFLGWADRTIAERKEREDAAERVRQFQTQMGSLRNVTGQLQTVTGSLGGLQTDMEKSLGVQSKLSGVAEQNLRISGALQTQSQANTLSVLRRVFEESNRIAAERIGISISYVCTAEDPEENLPQLESATLQITGASHRSTSLSTTEKLAVAEGVIFHGFIGDLGPYESFGAWRKARVTIRLTARPAAIGHELTIDSVRRRDELIERLGGRRPFPAVCRAAGALILNGRQIVTTPTAIAESRGGRWEIDFANLKVDPQRLPSFAK